MNFCRKYLIFNKLYRLPFNHLSTSFRFYSAYDNEFEVLLQSVKKFVRYEILPTAALYDESGEYPWETIKKAHSLGIMNTDLPKDLGGLALSLQSKIRIFEELGYADTGIGTSLMVNELAQIPMNLAGSNFLRQKYLKRMLINPILAAYAVTEPSAGSDLANAKTTAEKNGDYYILNGSKSWITNAGIASWYFVLARTTKDPKCPPGKAFTGFIVDCDAKGLTRGKKEKNIGQRCSDTRTLTLEDVCVPVENIVGQEGEGFLLAMRAFDRVRPVVASMACGLAQRALDEATMYSLQRKTFGRRIADYQGVSFKIADIALNLEGARALTQKSARMVDEKSARSTYYSSCAKVFATETAFQAASNAVQILGGNGLNSEYPVEKLLRDSKILQIYGGANEIQRLIISKKVLAEYK